VIRDTSTRHRPGCRRRSARERALFVAPNTPHAFAPADGRDADFLVVITPGKPRFDYYRLLDRVHRGEATWQEVGETQDRYDNHYVDSPVWPGRAAVTTAAG
jgi:hypothetical protein